MSWRNREKKKRRERGRTIMTLSHLCRQWETRAQRNWGSLVWAILDYTGLPLVCENSLGKQLGELITSSIQAIKLCIWVFWGGKELDKERKTFISSNIYLLFWNVWIPGKITLTGHFIRNTLLVPDWTPFCLQNCLNSSWHRFNKVLETFLRDFGPYWHDSITQLLQICRQHIYDANLPFHHIPKCSIVLRYSDCGGHLSKVNSLSCSRNQSEMIWCIILLEVAIRRWVHCSHKGMDVVSNNTQVGCGV